MTFNLILFNFQIKELSVFQVLTIMAEINGRAQCRLGPAPPGPFVDLSFLAMSPFSWYLQYIIHCFMHIQVSRLGVLWNFLERNSQKKGSVDKAQLKCQDTSNILLIQHIIGKKKWTQLNHITNLFHFKGSLHVSVDNLPL